MTLSRPISRDSGGARFTGPGSGADNWLPAGTRVGTTDYAAAHVLLVAADGTTALIVASGADAVSNTQNQVPTSARLQTYNGTTWDRARGDTTNGLDVDVTRLPALPAGAAIVGKVGIDQTTPGTTNAVQLAQASLTMTHSNFTVTTTSATYLALNANRKYARFQNDGATIIYLNFGATAVANQGIRLEANGGVYEISAANGNLTTAGIRAIVAAGTSSILITEGV